MSSERQQFDEQETLGKGFDWQLVKRLLRYLIPYRKKFIFLLLLVPVVVFFNQLWVLIFQRAIDGPIFESDKGLLLQYTVLFICIVTVGGLLTFILMFLGVWISQRAINTVRLQLFQHLQSLPLRYYDKNPVGRLLTVTIQINSTVYCKRRPLSLSKIGPSMARWKINTHR